ncbi:hypothetical protein ccbrp13_21250 [Ktedonobacteria bacterium brp13]|nr:hypothetical protein ccbrp13_21250 [Ktedonobacteria bacterium brp13]
MEGMRQIVLTCRREERREEENEHVFATSPDLPLRSPSAPCSHIVDFWENDDAHLRYLKNSDA